MFNLLKSKWLVVVIIAVIAWISLSIVKTKIQTTAMDKEITDLKTKIADLDNQNTSLQDFIENIDNPAFIDKEARLKLNYKSPDETVAFVYPDTNSDLTEEEIALGRKLAQMPNYLKWIYYALGY